MKLRTKIIYGVMFSLVSFFGLYPLILGLFISSRAILVSQDTVKTQAVVTAIERGVKCRTDKTFPTTNCINLTYTYVTLDHEEYIDTSSHISPIRDENHDYNIGDTLLVRYSRSHPHVNISGYGSLSFDIFFGIILSLLGIWVIVLLISNFKMTFFNKKIKSTNKSKPSTSKK